MKNKCIKYDLIFSLSMIMLIGAHLTTNVIIQMKADESQADYESVVKLVEANPFAAWILRLKKFNVMLKVLIMPTFFSMFYVVLRKRLNIEYLSLFVTMVFFFGLFNLTNDLSILLGMML